MWLARYFPGLNLDIEKLWEQRSPEQSHAVSKAGVSILEKEAKRRFETHTKPIAMAAGMRLR